MLLQILSVLPPSRVTLTGFVNVLNRVALLGNLLPAAEMQCRIDREANICVVI